MHACTQLSKAENVVNENLLFSDAHNCYWNFALQHLQNQLRDFGIFVSAVQEKWNHNKHRDHMQHCPVLQISLFHKACRTICHSFFWSLKQQNS